jgi:hypothetical protein
VTVPTGKSLSNTAKRRSLRGWDAGHPSARCCTAIGGERKIKIKIKKKIKIKIEEKNTTTYALSKVTGTLTLPRNKTNR